MSRFAPLLVMIVLAAVAYWYYDHTGDTLTEDRWLGLVIIAGWVLTILGMLAETMPWTFRAAALLLTIVGLVAFFGRFVLGLWDLPAPGWLDVFYRAAFLASAPVLLIDRLLWFAGWGRRLWRRGRR